MAGNREVEEMMWRLGGRKAMGARTYCSEEEFWEVYDREWYQRLRGSGVRRDCLGCLMRLVWREGRWS